MKKPWIIGLWVYAFICLLVVIFHFYQSKTYTVTAHDVDAEIIKFKKTLPFKEGGATYTSVERKANTLYYTLKINNDGVESNDIEDDRMKSVIIRNVCSRLDVLLRSGFILNISFEFADGGKKKAVIVKDDC